jgi:Amt family ammonium transporter
MDGATILLLSAMALLVRAGLAIYTSGLARSKNAASTLTRHLCDLCLAVIVFWAIGAALLEYVGERFLGINLDQIIGLRNQGTMVTFLHLSLVLLASGIVVGAVIERSKFWPILAVTVLVAGVIAPIAGQWAWNGWLGDRGFIDAGGASVVHLTGGLCAAITCVLLGARNGKYNRDGSANFIPGHNAPMASIGVLVMLAAWAPMVAGIAGIHYQPSRVVALNVLLSASAAGVAGLLLSRLRFGKPDLALLNSAVLGGLVAITAGANFVSTLGAVIIGVVAGLLVPLAIVRIDLKLRVDDPAGALAIHAVAAMWGLLAAGGLAPGTVADRLHRLAVQALGVAVISSLALIPTLALLLILRITVGLRSREADEYDGLDLAEHDLNAYPDFQQTMIKSYHLREA